MRSRRRKKKMKTRFIKILKIMISLWEILITRGSHLYNSLKRKVWEITAQVQGLMKEMSICKHQVETINPLHIYRHPSVRLISYMAKWTKAIVKNSKTDLWQGLSKPSTKSKFLQSQAWLLIDQLIHRSLRTRFKYSKKHLL